MTPTDETPARGLGQMDIEVEQAFNMNQPPPPPPPTTNRFASTPDTTSQSQQYFGAATPTSTMMAPSGLTLTNELFQMWLNFQQQQALAAQALATQVQANVPRPPRVGGVIERYGYWTGFGLKGDGKEPRTTDCMREFFREGIKEFTAIGDIQKRCRGGLSSIDGAPHFGQAHEKDADNL